MVLQSGIVAADVHHIIFDEQDNHSLIDPIADDSPESLHMDTEQHQCGHSHCVHFVAVPHVVNLPLSLFKETFFLPYQYTPASGTLRSMYRPPKA